MAEYASNDALLLVKAAASGDLTTKVATSAGWTDVSLDLKGNISINGTAASTVIEPAGGNDRGRRIPGAKESTLTVRFVAGMTPTAMTGRPSSGRSTPLRRRASSSLFSPAVCPVRFGGRRDPRRQRRQSHHSGVGFCGQH